MPKRSSKTRPDEDVNETAFRVMQEATDGESAGDDTPPEKNPHAVALGRRGGKKGGKARAAKLSPERRKEIAKKAAAARWKNRKKGDE
jgi:hypothetical protein